jgi:GTPase Era involved in 16S rRNA processing
MSDPSTLTISLISHTNVGKTTLARTLLRRDVGETLDRPHVTDISEAHVMVATQGRRLLLWDTPGFGDTARLLRRLKQSDQPIRWVITQLWDRYTNRPLWCSQQAVKNVREEADIVLYLVDASQKPEEMPYVEMEMEILSWIGKPVLLLLNQIGAPREPGEEAADEARWRDHLRRFEVVKAALSLDAFARCWVQEGELLEVFSPAVPVGKKDTFRLLREAWREKNLTVHREAVGVMSRALAASLFDVVKVSNESWLHRIGLKRTEMDQEMTEARRQLSERLSARTIEVTDELIKLFGLEGHSSKPLGQTARDLLGDVRKVNESLWTAIGGLATGLTSGVVVDILSHGTTVFAGTVLGGVSGMMGGYMLAKTFNLVRGKAGNEVRWSFAHYAEQVQLILLCYLAVSHFGRGRGEWEDGEHPDHWRGIVTRAVEDETERLEALWKEAGDPKPARTPEQIEEDLRGVITSACAFCLRELYPRVEVFA